MRRGRRGSAAALLRGAEVALLGAADARHSGWPRRPWRCGRRRGGHLRRPARLAPAGTRGGPGRQPQHFREQEARERARSIRGGRGGCGAWPARLRRRAAVGGGRGGGGGMLRLNHEPVARRRSHRARRVTRHRGPAAPRANRMARQAWCFGAGDAAHAGRAAALRRGTGHVYKNLCQAVSSAGWPGAGEARADLLGSTLALAPAA